MKADDVVTLVAGTYLLAALIIVFGKGRWW